VNNFVQQKFDKDALVCILCTKYRRDKQQFAKKKCTFTMNNNDDLSKDDTSTYTCISSWTVLMLFNHSHFSP